MNIMKINLSRKILITMSIWVPLIKPLRSTKNRLICINKPEQLTLIHHLLHVPAEVNLKIRNFDRALELVI